MINYKDEKCLLHLELLSTRPNIALIFNSDELILIHLDSLKVLDTYNIKDKLNANIKLIDFDFFYSHIYILTYFDHVYSISWKSN